MAEFYAEITENNYEIPAEINSASEDFDAEINLGSSGVSYKPGANIEITNNTISVTTTDKVEQDNTLPITSHGVYTVVGNINALLETI